MKNLSKVIYTISLFLFSFILFSSISKLKADCWYAHELPAYFGACNPAACEGMSSSSCSYGDGVSTQTGTAYYCGDNGLGCYYHVYSCTWEGDVCGDGGADPPPEGGECWPEPVEMPSCDPSNTNSLYTLWYTWDGDAFGNLVDQDYQPSTTLVDQQLDFQTSECISQVQEECSCGPDGNECGHCGYPSNYNTRFFGKCGGSQGEIPGNDGGCFHYFSKVMRGYLHVTSTGSWGFEYDSNDWGDAQSVGSTMLSMYLMDRDSDGTYEPACEPLDEYKIPIVGWNDYGQGNAIGVMDYNSNRRPTAKVTRNINLEAGYYPMEAVYIYRGVQQDGDLELVPYEVLKWKSPGGSYEDIPESALTPDDFFSGTCSLDDSLKPPECAGVAPTAEIILPKVSTPPGYYQVSPAGDIGGVYYPQSSLSVSAIAMDADEDLTSMTFHRAPQGTQSWWDFPSVGNNTYVCTGGTCNANTTPLWTPTPGDVGYWTIAVNAFDSGGLKCTGNWEMPQVGWADCGLTDNILVRVCGIIPNIPEPSSPSNGGTTGYNPTIFQWRQPGEDYGYGQTCDAVYTKSQVIHYKKSTDEIYISKAPNGGGGGNMDFMHLEALEPATLYDWYVTASNGEFSSSSPVWHFTTLDPQQPLGWFTSMGGDVYGGAMTVLGPLDPLVPPAPWSGYDYIANPKGSLFSAQNVDLVNLDPAKTDEEGVWAEYMNTEGFWNSKYDTFTAPADDNEDNVVNIESSSQFLDLDPTNVYILTDPDLLSSYDLKSSGIAVIYYTGDAPLNFDAEFRHVASDDASERVIFVTNQDINFGAKIGTPGATPASVGNIQAGFLTTGKITVTKGDTPGLDIPLVIDGFIVTPGAIDFQRITDENIYPGAIINYDPYYLTKLSEQIRSDTTGIYNGLSVSEIIWEGD